MAIKVKVHSNGDDALIAWCPESWQPGWIGFRLEKRSGATGTTTPVNNRIPPKVDGGGKVPDGGLSSALSPIRRCIWVDHSVEDTKDASYRVTPMIVDGAGFKPVDAAASEWTSPAASALEVKDGIYAVFNRGTLMSQVISRMLNEDISVAALKRFKTQLANPGFAGRRYLSGYARQAMLNFLAEADRRGNEVWAAVYEMNDRELVEGLKAFGKRAHLILGNGGTTDPNVANELGAAHVEVLHRDLSHKGASSPSVHNKFVVERDVKTEKAVRVLTGSTNWTVTGLCTQLNNVLVVNRPATAEFFHAQWLELKEAKDDMTAILRANNTKARSDGPITTYFAATTGQFEFKPVLQAIADAKQGILFLMFKPGNSPLLEAVLQRAKEPGFFVRGVVSEVPDDTKSSAGIVAHDATVYSSDAPPKALHESVLLPTGVPQDNVPAWAQEEINRKMYLPAGLNAIVHSKAIVIDPFSDGCVVVTGSHNFSDAASQKNDENLVVIKGNRPLAAAYAVHMEGVYDHFAWRAFLNSGGHPADIYESVKDWAKAGSNRAQELSFWMNS
jgi:phosphatidylserine/phosphatidylglycerophosphate/cardiolipin synthase-like enzyme